MSAMQPTETPAEAPKLSKRAKWRRLDSVQAVRMALASVIKKTYDGDMGHERASACIAGLRALGKVLHDSELERRLRAVEDRLRQ